MQRKPRSADETPKEGGTQLASHDPFREMAEIDNPHGTAAGLDRSRAREGGCIHTGSERGGGSGGRAGRWNDPSRRNTFQNAGGSTPRSELTEIKEIRKYRGD